MLSKSEASGQHLTLDGHPGASLSLSMTWDDPSVNSQDQWMLLSQSIPDGRKPVIPCASYFFYEGERIAEEQIEVR